MTLTPLPRRDWLRRLSALLVLTTSQDPEEELPGRKRFSLTARRYGFDPDVIDVRQNDIVRLTVTSEDIAHSFTVDAYRIQKRIPPGGSVTFEFRADEVGRFPFYCSMRADPRCQEMRGELIVR